MPDRGDDLTGPRMAINTMVLGSLTVTHEYGKPVRCDDVLPGRQPPGLPIFQAGHEGSIPFARSDEKPQVTGSCPALEPLRSAPRVPGVPDTCPTNDGWPSHPTSGPALHEKVLGQTPRSGVQPGVLAQFVCAWQGVVNRKWVRKSRDRLIQQVEDRALNSPARRPRQSLDVLPGGPRKPNEAITH